MRFGHAHRYTHTDTSARGDEPQSCGHAPSHLVVICCVCVCVCVCSQEIPRERAKHMAELKRLRSQLRNAEEFRLVAWVSRCANGSTKLCNIRNIRTAMLSA